MTTARSGLGRGYAPGLTKNVPLELELTDGNLALRIATEVEPQHVLIAEVVAVGVPLLRALYRLIPPMGDGLNMLGAEPLRPTVAKQPRRIYASDLDLLDAVEWPG